MTTRQSTPGAKKKKSAIPNRMRSMTGFGSGTRKSPYGDISVEIKTLNYKSMSIVCSPLGEIFLLEAKIKKALENRLYRGKVFIRIRISKGQGSGKKTLRKIEVDEAAIREYLRQIRKIQKQFDIKGEIGIQDVIDLPGVLGENELEQKVYRHVVN